MIFRSDLVLTEPSLGNNGQNNGVELDLRQEEVAFGTVIENSTGVWEGVRDVSDPESIGTNDGISQNSGSK